MACGAGCVVALIGSEASARPARGVFAGILERVRAWRDDVSHTSIAQKVAGSALLIRMVSAALVFGSQIFFARWMGSFELGIYVYVCAWVLLIGEFADLGLASAAQRFIPQYTNTKTLTLLRGFLDGSRWLVLGIACAIALSGVGAVKLAEPLLASYLVLPLLIACATLPFYAVMSMQDGIARSYNWVHLALLPVYVIRHIVMLVLLAAAYLAGLPTDAVTVVGVLAVSLALTVAGQTFMLNRRLAADIEHGPKAMEVRAWFAVSLPMLMVSGFYLVLTHTDVLLLQQFRPPNDIATYYAASKTIALVSFVSFAVAAAVAHRFTEYHVNGDRLRLAEFLADSIRWTFWPSVAATLLILAIGQPLLSLFGASFVQGYGVMFILAVGLLARAAVGPVERLLAMLNEQRICAAVYAFAFVVNLLLCIVLIPQYGIEGAATSTATAMVAESVLLFLVTRNRLKLHAFVWGRRQAQ
jgi:O-antigen/teichoic acid export membrane protein